MDGAELFLHLRLVGEPVALLLRVRLELPTVIGEVGEEEEGEEKGRRRGGRGGRRGSDTGGLGIYCTDTKGAGASEEEQGHALRRGEVNCHD